MTRNDRQSHDRSKHRPKRPEEIASSQLSLECLVRKENLTRLIPDCRSASKEFGIPFERLETLRSGQKAITPEIATFLEDTLNLKAGILDQDPASTLPQLSEDNIQTTKAQNNSTTSFLPPLSPVRLTEPANPAPSFWFSSISPGQEPPPEKPPPEKLIEDIPQEAPPPVSQNASENGNPRPPQTSLICNTLQEVLRAKIEAGELSDIKAIKLLEVLIS